MFGYLLSRGSGENLWLITLSSIDIAAFAETLECRQPDILSTRLFLQIVSRGKRNAKVCLKPFIRSVRKVTNFKRFSLYDRFSRSFTCNIFLNDSLTK